MMQPSQGVPSYIDYTGVQSVQHPDFGMTVPVLYNVLFHTFAVIAKIDLNSYTFFGILKKCPKTPGMCHCSG